MTETMTIATTCVVAASVADIRSDPDPASELVTQALMNVQAIPGEASGAWTHVTLSDYEGWIRTDQLEEPIVKGFCKVGVSCGTALPYLAVVIATHTPLYAHAEGDEFAGKVYLSTALPIQDITHPQRLQVALPGERLAWLDRYAIDIRDSANPYPQAPIGVVTAYARLLLGRPYLWGGSSWEGIDCSGFVQLCYRMGGSIIPRDAHQQHDFLQMAVERADMREGDLIFFGSKSITHVGMALNNKEYIHSAGGNYSRVVINSFDPAAPHYYPRLDQIVWAIKRVVV
jgi:gamma-D-glutamyl-L-lysine dipeptidyl-peptidase